MKKFISLLVLFFIFSQIVSAQNNYSAELLKDCSLTITGSTNITPFKISQKGEKLSRSKITVSTTQSQNKIYLSQNQLSVVVKNFGSTNMMALKDFLKLVKSDTYPTLQIQLNYLDLLPLTDKGQTHNGTALANITITGKTKSYSIPITFTSNGSIYTIDGNKKLSVTDFGLKPQDKMMGLIKVSDWIDIDFHMICKIQSEADVAKL